MRRSPPAHGEEALSWWTLRGAARTVAAAVGWVSVRGEYRPLITAAREAKRWDLVRELITERRGLPGADHDHSVADPVRRGSRQCWVTRITRWAMRAAPKLRMPSRPRWLAGCPMSAGRHAVGHPGGVAWAAVWTDHE